MKIFVRPKSAYDKVVDDKDAVLQWEDMDAAAMLERIQYGSGTEADFLEWSTEARKNAYDKNPGLKEKIEEAESDKDKDGKAKPIETYKKDVALEYNRRILAWPTLRDRHGLNQTSNLKIRITAGCRISFWM